VASLVFKHASVDIRADLGEFSESKTAAILQAITPDFPEDMKVPFQGAIVRRSADKSNLIAVTKGRITLSQVGAEGHVPEHYLPVVRNILEKCLVDTVKSVSIAWSGEDQSVEGDAAETCRRQLDNDAAESFFSGSVEAVGFHLFLTGDGWVGDARLEPMARDKSKFFASFEVVLRKPIEAKAICPSLAEKAKEQVAGAVQGALARLGLQGA